MGEHRKTFTNSVRDGWKKAGQDASPLTENWIAKEIKDHHPHKWAQLQHDIKWLKSEMTAMGLDADDFRFIL